MKSSIKIEEARSLAGKYISKEHTLAHSRETEVVMRALARYFKEDEELWGVCGLLHDLDFDLIDNKLEEHAKKTIAILREEGYELPVIFKAVLAHVENPDSVIENRESKLEYALSAADNITGIIIAYALILPGKKLDKVEPKSVLKRLKEKSFAAKVNRQRINDIEKTGLTKESFVELAVVAIKEIAPELGL